MLLALGGVDNVIRLCLRPPEGEFFPVCRLAGHGDWVRALAFTSMKALQPGLNNHGMHWLAAFELGAVARLSYPALRDLAEKARGQVDLPGETRHL